jgi:hypothetical protein
MRQNLLGLAVLAGAALGCDAGARSATGFRLPDGDPQAGRAAFVELRCHSCHTVAGETVLPAPVAQPAVGVPLGGVGLDTI